MLYDIAIKNISKLQKKFTLLLKDSTLFGNSNDVFRICNKKISFSSVLVKLTLILINDELELRVLMGYKTMEVSLIIILHKFTSHMEIYEPNVARASEGQDHLNSV